MLLKRFVAVGTTKPEYEVADVFRKFGAAYRRRYPTSWKQRKVMSEIANCRTSALGGYVEQCDECGKLRICYCSCKDRHCPKCGAFEKAQWLAKQEALLLPTPYFHVVFTTDHAINDLARVNQRKVYQLLFDAASDTLKAYGEKYLGGMLGFTAVLHTWGQTMEEHIHLHVIVTGGAFDGQEWHASEPGFLFPVVEMSADFRDRFCRGLLKLYRDGELALIGKAAEVDVEALVEEMRAKKWEVFIREAFDDPEQLYEYLGRYVYKTAISNYRIVDISGREVSFTYYDNKDDGAEKVMTLDAFEFIRRFLLHVLPSYFHRIRYYGLHHSSKRGVLARIRGLLGLEPELPEVEELELHEWIMSVTGEDPRVCPFCGEGRMRPYREFGEVSKVKSVFLGWLGVPRRGRVAA